MIKSTPLTHITLKLNDVVIPVETFKFSAGEIQVKLDVEALAKAEVMAIRDVHIPTLKITANIRSSDDLITLMLIVNAFGEWANSVSVRMPGYTTCITLPYFPYSRQDRACSPGEANGLRMMSALLQSETIDGGRDISITTWDMHNPKATYAGIVTRNISSTEFIISTLATVYKGGVNIVCPDKGARERAVEICHLAQTIAPNSGIIYLDKDRDPNTGAIRGIKLDEMTIRDPSLPCLIVDDICDGGRTFIGAAEVLKSLFPNGKKGPVVDLYVTHGIFSAGFDTLRKAFRQIYIANNVNGIELPAFVKVVSQ